MNRELACRLAGLLLVSGGGIALLPPNGNLSPGLSASSDGAPIAAWMALLILAAGLSLIFSTHRDQRPRDRQAPAPIRSAGKWRRETMTGAPMDYVTHIDPAGFGSGRVVLASYLVLRDRAERERARETGKIKRPHIVTVGAHRIDPVPAPGPVS